MNLNQINQRFMFQDSLSVFRYTVTEDEDGTNKRELKAVSELADIPCKLDIKKADEAKLPETINIISATFTVFAGPEHSILAGDHFVVMHQGRSYSLTAASPILYLHHQEIPAELEQLA